MASHFNILVFYPYFFPVALPHRARPYLDALNDLNYLENMRNWRAAYLPCI